MRIDFSKNTFTDAEKKYMLLEVNRLKETNPNHIPLLVLIDSNVLNMEKQKFLISPDINFNDFVNNTLKKKLIHLQKDDTIVVHAISLSEIDPQRNKISISKRDTIKELYNAFRDPESGLLILKVSRLTTAKWVKNLIGL